MGYFVDVSELVLTDQPLNRPFNRHRPRLTAETTGSPNPPFELSAASRNAEPELGPTSRKATSAWEVCGYQARDGLYADELAD
jgi:hypothetical protein